MSQTMQMEIDRAVNKFTPPMEVGGGFLTRDEYAKFARMAVTEGHTDRMGARGEHDKRAYAAQDHRAGA